MSRSPISEVRELIMRMDTPDRLDHLQAVQDLYLWAQRNTCTKDGGQCGLGGYCEPCHSVEAVAWRIFNGEGGFDFTEDEDLARHWKETNGTEYASWCEPLYSHPPAQGSVVLSDDEILSLIRPAFQSIDGGYACDTAGPEVVAAVRLVLSKVTP